MSGEPLIRYAIRNGMRIIAHQFVLGRNMDEAIIRGEGLYGQAALYSLDMLGEAAMTRQDAEEAETLNITLDLFAALNRDAAVKDWEGLGIVVQAYQKRAPAVIEWLNPQLDGLKGASTGV